MYIDWSNTVTTAGDVGAKVLARATIDSAASFLPSLSSVVALSASLNNLPSAVPSSLQLLEAALLKKKSQKRSTSTSLATIDDPEDGDLEDERDEEAEGKSNHTGSSASMGASIPAAAATSEKGSAKKRSVRSNTEQILQDCYNVLFPHLIKTSPSSLRFHDTSVRDYLTNPTGKIDITLTASGLVAWPDVVTLVELKPSLQPKPAYEEAVGQVIQRCQEIFDIQEKRQFAVGVVMDGKRIDVLRVARTFPVQVTHTGCLPFELAPDSVGFKMLLRVLTAPFDKLGFTAALLPEPFELPLLAGNRPTRTKHVVKDFIPLRVGSLSLRTSAIYRAACNLWPDQPIVVKFTPASVDPHNDGNIHEARILESLAVGGNCSSIPTLLAQGVLSRPIEHLHHYIIIQPYGTLLPLGDDASASLICGVFIDVCEAMRFAYETQRILHRDISYGNIVRVEDKGYLIDWHVAHPQQATCFTDRITGTPLFTAHRLHFPEHAHDLRDDLESLLYVLIYIATGGRLPWDHAPHKTMDALKKWHLAEASPFHQLVLQCSQPLQAIIRALREVLFTSEAEVVSAVSTSTARASNLSLSPTSDSLSPAAGLALLHRFVAVLRS